MMDRRVGEIMREEDAIYKKIKYARKKFKQHINLVDFEIRNSFYIKVTKCIMNCVVGYNYHRERNRKVNKNLVEEKYL